MKNSRKLAWVAVGVIILVFGSTVFVFSTCYRDRTDSYLILLGVEEDQLLAALRSEFRFLVSPKGAHRVRVLETRYEWLPLSRLIVRFYDKEGRFLRSRPLVGWRETP